MKTALITFSWIVLAIGILAIVGGLTALSDPGTGTNAIIGGALFAIEGVLALTYVHAHK